MNILFFGDKWDDMWRRRQQLAWRLSRTDMFEHVIYIERPLPTTSFIKFLVGRADRDGKDRWRRVISNHSWLMPVWDKLSVLTTYAPLPPVGISWLFYALERTRDRWFLRKLKKHFNIYKPMVWISHPQISVEVIKALEPSLIWYDCTEDFSSFPGTPDCMREQIEVTDCWLTEHANVVTAVSHTLYNEKQHVNPNTHWLPNAVDADLFLQSPESFRVPPELQSVSRPVLTFVGGLNEWSHNWVLLDQVAALRPEWTILLIGGLSLSRETQQMLHSHPNVLCVGQKPYQKLPAYLYHSDVCFLFYRSIRKNNTGNSQKLFLYLAAGKPVVSTPSADVLAYQELVHVVETADGFVTDVERALEDDCDDLRQRRQAFARENSWTQRITSITEMLRYVEPLITEK